MLGARGKEGMKEFEGALPSSFLLLELLLELLKKGKMKTNINVFLPLLQITLFVGKIRSFCYTHLMVFQNKNTGHLFEVIYSSRVNTIFKVSLDYSLGYSTQ